MPLPPLHFDNAFLRELPGDPDAGPGIRQVHGALWSRVDPEPVALPRLLAHSQEIAEQLAFDPQTVASPEFAAVFAGNALMPGLAPFAANYGGHQFGHWAGPLGDGVPLTLGAEIAAAGHRPDPHIQSPRPPPVSPHAAPRPELRPST